MNTENPAPDPVLRVEGLSKTYQQRAVLRQVGFQVDAGERVAIRGPSGSGKSTLLNCLAGIDRPDTGTVWLAGRTVTGSTPGDLAQLRRSQVSTIFQFFHLLPTLSVYENIELPLQLLGVDRSTRDERVIELLEAVQLTHRKEALATELSGGEMQRVAIARALIHRPRLILADEPTGNLDSRTGQAVLALMESLTNQWATALLLVTHSDEATRICHRVLHMVDGQLEAMDT